MYLRPRLRNNNFNYCTYCEKLNPECYICLNHFENNEKIIVLPCKHLFHIRCINIWLSNFSNKCPTCRKVVGFLIPCKEQP
jgi:hypothetical protein